MKKDLELLKKVKLFENITEKNLELLFKNIKYEVKKLKKNDIIYFRGDILDGISIILSGVLSAEMLKETGDIVKIENLYVGDIIASAFIFGKNNIIPVDLIALCEVQILNINKKNLLKLFNLNEVVLINFLNNISDKTQFLSNKVWKNFNSKTIKEKILDYIEENRIGEVVLFPHSIKELSELFEVTRPSLSRVITELIDNGMIERKGKNKFKLNYKKK